MRGHITKRGKNSYSIVLDAGTDPKTGKRTQQWITVPGPKKEAEKRLGELIHQVDTGIYTKPGKTTVADFLLRWVNDYRPNLSPRGYERYEGIVKGHLVPALGHLQLTQLKPEHIQAHYTAAQTKGLSARTVRYHHAVLHVALKTAVKYGQLARNPADAVTPPKKRRTEMKVWNEDEISRFLEEAKNTPYYELFYMALFTGMRRGELLAMRWADIDFIFNQVHVTRSLHHLKNGSYIFTEPKSDTSRRSIAMTPSTSLLLKACREKRALDQALLNRSLSEDTLLFSHPDGRPLRPNTITNAWNVTAKHAGLKAIRLHDARHTHASILLKQGVHPKIVQERLGHSSIEITLDIYSHVAPGLQEAAAARFDQALELHTNDATLNKDPR
ncbi:MAG: tyrosine-type recombinase/integrase [Dehalococcoidia bacterium]